MTDAKQWNALVERARKCGTDEEFLAWVRLQPSCISGQFSEYLHGEGRCVAAHIRRSATSGIGYKPPYCAVPLTDAEHKITHQKGETALRPKHWWSEQAVKHLQKWIISRGI
jgi:hypothetical protein